MEFLSKTGRKAEDRPAREKREAGLHAEGFSPAGRILPCDGRHTAPGSRDATDDKDDNTDDRHGTDNGGTDSNGTDSDDTGNDTDGKPGDRIDILPMKFTRFLWYLVIST